MVDIPPLDLQQFVLTLVGDSPLITHQWSEKAKQMMRDKHAKKAQKGREKRDPVQEFEEATYYLPKPVTLDGQETEFGMPAVAFKAAAVASCRFVPGLAMTEARGAFHVLGELVPIFGERTMREDMVRVGNGAADIRYRPEFSPWSTTFIVQHNAAAISMEQVLNLFSIAGCGVGVGEWRPSSKSSGPYGRWHIAKESD